MTHAPMRRRLATIAAAAAVVGAGLTAVPALPGVVGDAGAATCNNETTVKKTLIVDYAFTKSIPKEVGQGQPLVYSLSLTTNSIGNPYVQGVWDIPPKELRDVKPTVKVKAFTMVGGIIGGGGAFGKLINETVIPPNSVLKDGISWKISHTGWAVFSGQSFTAEFSYAPPASYIAGKQVTSGGATFQATPAPPLGYVEMGQLTACTTVRAPNAGEAVLGSLDSAGLGSKEGQLSSTGSLVDIIPGLIGGLGGGEKKDDGKK
ncbi:hypothetical protein nbrc107696_24180 [Gordonia spumicola]|uniref:Uncharacterized protein n=1 Tax=Gordonia spumicola TaxID=589161 RepID=A0A7I9V9Q3_9ACTN|nr:hypothetical protein [Gordonia spumicola]GEE01972.1 hypothetical protein nbrc107696_24180 [Gordonia spumicola]